ncbi:mucin-3A-like [Mixophyes fleayi]|uniref:mucin-3A-like n=1 Tax=Mixophyes fleayi TaxID=3061075 RepID=UPI003F4E2DD7
MGTIYSAIPGYKDVIILSLSKGSVVVDHEVIVEIEYKEEVNVAQNYEKIVQDLKTYLNELKAQNCTKLYTAENAKFKSVTRGSLLNTSNAGLCVDGAKDPIVNTKPLPTEEETCITNTPVGYENFYTPYMKDGVLTCVSHCNELSPKYLNCYIGSCQILNMTGPRCLCPDTNIYMYMSTQCQGKVLKAGVYGGVGATIALLFIIILTVAYLLYRKQHLHTWDLFSDHQTDSWFDDEDKWSVSSGIRFMDNESLYQSERYTARKESFKPALDKVDTSIQVKFVHPEVIKQ